MELSDFIRMGECRKADPELFFPLNETTSEDAPAALAQIEEAKRVCGACVVRRECLDWALARPGEEGVWGGTTSSERKKIRAGELTVEEVLSEAA